jgi:hypothetical protein
MKLTAWLRVIAEVIEVIARKLPASSRLPR